MTISSLKIDPKKKKQKNFDYDVFVVGGGSAGLAFVKEAKKIKKNLKIGCVLLIFKGFVGNSGKKKI